MTTTTAGLAGGATALLLNATTCGFRVYAPRDWPTWDNNYPALFVSAPRERKQGLGRGTPQFDVTGTVRVAARASAPGAADDGNAGVVQAQLWAIQRQVEVAIVNASADQLPIQQVLSIESQVAFSATGEKHLGELVMEFELEFFQNWDDFAPLRSDEIDEIVPDFVNYPIFAPGYGPALRLVQGGYLRLQSGARLHLL